MPGSNCAFPECGATRREKYDGIGIFQLQFKILKTFITIKI